MIFHTPDPSFKNIKTCYKRAKALGRPLTWYEKLWSVVLKALGLRRYTPLEIQFSNLETCWSEDYTDNLVLLDWFAVKVDEYSNNNLLAADPFSRQVLYSWSRLLFINPTQLRQL